MNPGLPYMLMGVPLGALFVSALRNMLARDALYGLWQLSCCLLGIAGEMLMVFRG